MKLLEGKTAIITGASRGIGKAVALEFARQGANIAFTDLRYDEIAQETEKEIAALGVKAKMFASNAADFAATNATVDEISDSRRAWPKNLALVIFVLTLLLRDLSLPI